MLKLLETRPSRTSNATRLDTAAHQNASLLPPNPSALAEDASPGAAGGMPMGAPRSRGLCCSMVGVERGVGWIDGWVNVYICPHLNTSFARIKTCVVSGWMDGWVDGWMVGWMGGWMDRWVDGWMDGWVDGWWDKDGGIR